MSREWKRLAKSVLADPWVIQNKMAYIRPVGWVLYGLLWERSSARPESRYLWRIRMPLYEYFDFIDLSFSTRHGSGTTVFDPLEPTTALALRDAADWVMKASQTDPIAIETSTGDLNYGMMETRAYGMLLSGNKEAAIEMLARAIIGFAGDDRDWALETLERMKWMKALIQAGEIDSAVEQLKQYRAHLIESIGIDPADIAPV